MGAVVITLADPGPNPVDYFGSRKIVFGTLTMSAAYAEGGDSFTAGQLGLERVDYIGIAALSNGGAPATGVVVAPKLPTDTGFTAAGTIQAFETGAAVSGPLAEVAAATNLSAYTAPFIAMGF